MEVFSRRIPSPPRREGEAAYPLFAPEQVLTLFQRRCADICSRFEEWRTPIRVKGVIGEVPVECWRRREATPLLDAHTGAALLLEIPPALVAEEGLRTGETVQVIGVLRAHAQQGQLTLRMDVLSLTRDALEEAHRQSEMVMELMRSLPPRRRAFPTQEGARMLLLGLGVGSERLAHMVHALGGLWSERNVTLRAVSEAEGPEALQNLSQIEHEIIFLIMAKGHLSAWEQPACIKALSRCPAYRILACDGGGDEQEGGTLLAHLVEQYFTTPLEAAEFIRYQSVEHRQRQDEERAHQEEVEALRTSLAALTQRPTEGPPRLSMLALTLGVVLGVSLIVAGHWFLGLF